MLPSMLPDEPDMRVSHETIYQALFVQTRGQLRRELTAHLRTGRSTRQPQGSGHNRRQRQILAPIPISARPPEIADRAVPGHWEGDLLMGASGKGAVITLVERASRFVLLAPPPARHTAELTRDELTRMILQPTRRAAPHPDLGPRQRDGLPRRVQHQHPRDRLLLRSAQPLATRHE